MFYPHVEQLVVDGSQQKNDAPERNGQDHQAGETYFFFLRLGTDRLFLVTVMIGLVQ